MLEEELIAAVQGVGFPVVAFGAIYRLADTTIRENTKAITELREAVARLCEQEKKEV